MTTDPPRSDLRAALDGDDFRDEHERAMRDHILAREHVCDDLCSDDIVTRLVAALAVSAPDEGRPLARSGETTGALYAYGRLTRASAPDEGPCAYCAALSRQYNAACANGHGSEARALDRRIADHQRSHARRPATPAVRRPLGAGGGA